MRRPSETAVQVELQDVDAERRPIDLVGGQVLVGRQGRRVCGEQVGEVYAEGRDQRGKLWGRWGRGRGHGSSSTRRVARIGTARAVVKGR